MLYFIYLIPQSLNAPIFITADFLRTKTEGKCLKFRTAFYFPVEVLINEYNPNPNQHNQTKQKKSESLEVPLVIRFPAEVFGLG